jgi:antitoxin component YwqK of YwqJK toxin-antitoxin module
MYHEDGWHSGGVTFVNGLREGEYRSWFKDGQPESILPVRRGEAHGTQLEYWEGGKPKRKTQWEHGKKQGWDVKYDEDGNKTPLFYKDGELVDPQPEYSEDEPTDKDD